MKVVLVNGSPNKDGCTYTALGEAAEALDENGIETEIFWIGRKAVSGCTACMHCIQTGRCVFDDRVNEFIEIANRAHGFIFGSPVHYAAMSGSMTSFMDRAFFSTISRSYADYYLKPAAAVVSARRAGTTAAFDQMNKYFTWAEMPVISSRYWNMVHGSTPEEVRQDLEGMQIMRVLGQNMAWFLKCKEAGLKAGVPFPERETRVSTNFIR